MRPAKQFLVLCLASYFVTLKLHAGLLARGKALEQGKVGMGIGRPCRAWFFPALQGGNDDLGILLSTWVYILTSEAKRFNPSNIDADISTRGPAATFDVFARVSTYFFHMDSLQPFSKIVRFSCPIFQLNSFKKCLKMCCWSVLLVKSDATSFQTVGCL